MEPTPIQYRRAAPQVCNSKCCNTDGGSSCCSSCRSVSLARQQHNMKLLLILPLMSARAPIAVADSPTIPQPTGPPLDADLLTPTFRTPRLDKSQKADGVATGVATILNAAATNHSHRHRHHRHHRHHHTQQSWAPVVNLGSPRQARPRSLAPPKWSAFMRCARRPILRPDDGQARSRKVDASRTERPQTRSSHPMAGSSAE